MYDQSSVQDDLGALKVCSSWSAVTPEAMKRAGEAGSWPEAVGWLNPVGLDPHATAKKRTASATNLKVDSLRGFVGCYDNVLRGSCLVLYHSPLEVGSFDNSYKSLKRFAQAPHPESIGIGPSHLRG